MAYEKELRMEGREDGGGEDDILIRMKEERIEAERHIAEIMKEAGRGLYQSQVRLKQAPWKVMWLKQDLMIERQEMVLDILTKINGNLEKIREALSK